MQKPDIKYSSKPVLQPHPGCDWADTMVLNPAILKDPETTRLHMLFRATGPYHSMQNPGQPLPYPIFLGYAFSDDNGVTWQADFSRPALAPRLKQVQQEIRITNIHGESVIDYSNGCIEDPRLFRLEGEHYLTVACRMFPPGPYWEHDDPMQCAPKWATEGEHDLGKAASENGTVTVLFRVDLEKLAAGDYENAFVYVTNLTDSNRSDNRDAFLFPEKLNIEGREKYVLIHRPKDPYAFPLGSNPGTLNIYLAAADRFEDFISPDCKHVILAEPKFVWEANRIGASWPPVRINENEWLLAYHGKQDDIIGYTQSFMILREQPGALPVVTHRCGKRLIYAQQQWELEGRFTIPCHFSCSGILIGDELVMGYGAADEKIGIARTNFTQLIEYLRQHPNI